VRRAVALALAVFACGASAGEARPGLGLAIAPSLGARFTPGSAASRGIVAGATLALELCRSVSLVGGAGWAPGGARASGRALDLLDGSVGLRTALRQQVAGEVELGPFVGGGVGMRRYSPADGGGRTWVPTAYVEAGATVESGPGWSGVAALARARFRDGLLRSQARRLRWELELLAFTGARF